MTYYSQQVQSIRQTAYPKDHICKQVIRSKHFIDTHFSENISLQDIAGDAALSKFHFIRQFKKCYGITPFQYLTDVRINAAKQHLKSGYSVSETCYLLGFSSLSTFSGLFKKANGATPAAFSKKKAILKK
jgi:AraC-like DNA-binding protein